MIERTTMDRPRISEGRGMLIAIGCMFVFYCALLLSVYGYVYPDAHDADVVQVGASRQIDLARLPGRGW